MIKCSALYMGPECCAGRTILLRVAFVGNALGRGPVSGTVSAPHHRARRLQPAGMVQGLNQRRVRVLQGVEQRAAHSVALRVRTVTVCRRLSTLLRPDGQDTANSLVAVVGASVGTFVGPPVGAFVGRVAALGGVRRSSSAAFAGACVALDREQR